MKFEDFIRKGVVKKTIRDIGKIKALIKSTKEDFEYIEGLKIIDISSRKLTSNYYEILRSILEAIAFDKGYKVYSHKAFYYFLLEIQESIIAEKFDRYRQIRNAINYYGKPISTEEANEYIKEMKEMINYLLDKYLGEFK
ncbi:hypothetical protein CMI38_00610 [Candidatus Pacearchaeota archaeon]|nr:hypothetical protein [Candidatus Pacearchaeota archaeon]|tara:strand:- start:3444 stop:3863 length:420 start_codon:yes stop_codon:yes gene_type:complete